MKKQIISTVIILVVGLVLCIGGGLMYRGAGGDAFAQSLEYTEYNYEAENQINTIDLEVSGDCNLILKRGESCEVEYSQSEISEISIKEEDGVLKFEENVQWRKNIFNWYKKRQKTDLTITVPEDTVLTLDCEFGGAVTATLPAWTYGNIDIEVSGAAEIKCDGQITADDVDVDVNGAAKLNLSGQFKSLNISTSGASVVNMDGKVDTLDLSASGSSTFTSSNLECGDVKVKASGSVKLDLKGSGDKFTARVSGSCKMSAEEFTLSTADLTVSGSAKVDINVSQKINAKVSGSAKVNYYGDPQIEKSVSGSAKFNKVG